MICTEVAKMYEFVRKVVVPVGAAAILAALFLSFLCGKRAVRLPEIVDIYGNSPLAYIRCSCGSSRKALILAAQWGCLYSICWLGGVIGGFALVWRLLMAAFYLVKTVFAGISRLMRAKAV